MTEYARPEVRLSRLDELPIIAAIDDDASLLFADAGLSMDHLHPKHPFVVREHARWAEAVRAGRLFVASSAQRAPVGFAALGYIGEEAHLGQLSVLRTWMRRGIGSQLLAHARRWSEGKRGLWLTTYDHVPWNRPYYERRGFARVPESECPSEIRQILAEERSVLPAPEQRVAMRLAL